MRVFLQHKYSILFRLHHWLQRVAGYVAVFSAHTPEGIKGEVMANTKIILCTIASTKRLVREWMAETGEDLRVHTVIVDECGCTAESSVALLLNLQPDNLILVGDHKQLPPVSMVPPQELRGSGHDRSLLERCVVASGSVHRLQEQYRMPAPVCAVVSRLFYNDLLTTPATIAADRRSKNPHPMVWVDVQGSEGVAPGSASYVNMKEVECCHKVARKLRKLYPNASIACLTLYKGQLVALKTELAANLRVEVLTVDACQVPRAIIPY